MRDWFFEFEFFKKLSSFWNPLIVKYEVTPKVWIVLYIDTLFRPLTKTWKCNNAYNNYKVFNVKNEKSNYIIDGRMVKETC